MENSFFLFLTTNENAIKILSSMITTAIAIIGAVWVALKALTDLQSYIRGRREKEYTEAIKQFSDVNEEKRDTSTEEVVSKKSIIPKLSALQAVSKYCKESYEQVFYLCALETDIVIRTRLRQTLIQHSRHAYKFLEMINRLMTIICVNISSDPQFGKEQKLLQDNEIDILQNEQPETKLDAGLLEAFGNNKISYDVENIFNLFLLSSSILGEAICAIRIGPFIGYKSQLLYKANFYNRALRLTTLDTCVIKNCISNRLKASFMAYKNCRIINDNFTDANFLRVLISTVHFSNANMENARFRGCHVYQCELLHCCLSKASYIRTKLSDECFINDCRLNGTVFSHCMMDTLKIFGSEEMGSLFNSCTIQRLHFRKGEVLIEFNNCTIKTIEMEAVRMQNTVFRKCTFTHGRFAGSTMRNVRFIDCVFHEPLVLHKNHEMDTAEVICSGRKQDLKSSPNFIIES